MAAVGDKVRVQDIKTGRRSNRRYVEVLHLCEDGATYSVGGRSADGQQMIRNLKYVRLYLGPDQ